MKVQDLMIGDWVLYNGIANKIALADFGIDKGHTKWRNAIEPIPLTPEILEKNGFEPYEDDMESFHSDDCVFIKQSDEGYGVCLDRKVTISGKINYVHELQHAFRLCGIDKEIVL